ncbi:Gfo/Idh/MocA family protein [Acidipila sp. EB88]|uniref:Gfo/Idh/MocA family protein n=1 Tax=Acidipila sp. EB88 TaxID=2305226 RepID=UPI001F3A196B|nr:Gfo/Idh/MocA family oxidoreductase [Acidipila sp. EB88]
MRFGILGFGHHAAKRLVPAFKGAHTARLEGLWRRDPVKAAADAAKFSVPQVFASAEELCTSPLIDAVFVVSPDALHLEHVLLALRAGKPVLCEKPLAMNTAQVEEMLVVAEAAGVLFGVAQNMRYNLSIDLMRRWVEEGRIGKPQLAHAQFCYDTARSPRAWINDPSLALGGPIGDVGIHCIDALCYVLGEPVSEVSTMAHRDAASGEVESHAIVNLSFDSGTLATVTTTTRAAYRSLIEITGEKGSLSCEDALTIDHPVSLVQREAGRIVLEQPVSNADAFSRMLDGFAEAAAGGDIPYRAPAMEGLQNQKVLDAAYLSWRERRLIRVP